MDEGLRNLLDTLEEKTDRSFGREEFSARLRTQKALYLLKCRGLTALESVDFNNYVRGPYAPTLARLYYGKGEFPRYDVEDWTPREGSLAVVLDAVEQGDSFLEGVATIRGLADQNPSANREKLLKYANIQKPNLGVDWEEAYDFLSERDLL